MRLKRPSEPHLETDAAIAGEDLLDWRQLDAELESLAMAAAFVCLKTGFCHIEYSLTVTRLYQDILGFIATMKQRDVGSSLTKSAD